MAKDEYFPGKRYEDSFFINFFIKKEKPLESLYRGIEAEASVPPILPPITPEQRSKLEEVAEVLTLRFMIEQQIARRPLTEQEVQAVKDYVSKRREGSLRDLFSKFK